MNIKCTFYQEDSTEFPWDENSLDAFKKLIYEKKIKCRMDDVFLLGFLRARKFDMDRSLKLLKNYYSIRKKYPRYFKNLLPSKLQDVLSFKSMQFLPNPDQRGRYIYITQPGDWDPSVADGTEYIRTFLLLTDFQLNFHRTQQNRIVTIMNASGITLRHLLQCSPRVLNSLVSIVFKDSYQLRFEEIHFVNLNIILKAFLTLFVPLLPAKLQKRVHLHVDMNTLHKFIHPQYLPVEYGGELPSFDASEANNVITDNEEFFRMNEEYLDSYEEGISHDFTEDRSRDVDNQNESCEKRLSEIEEKFNRFTDDSEKGLASLEENFQYKITQL